MYSLLNLRLIATKFGTNNDYLVDLVLNGKKRTTTSLYDFNDVIHFILFYHENNEKTFIELNELDLAKMIGNIPQK